MAEIGTVRTKPRKPPSYFLLVLRTAAVATETIVFAPGVLIRMGCQFIVAQMTGSDISHANFSSELGGEIEGEVATGGWTALLLATAFPIVIGLVLLLPSILGSALLGINVIPTVPLNAKLVFTHSTSSLPFVTSLDALGRVDFFRLWFGFSCFFCSVPSAAILDGVAGENSKRPRHSLLRLFTAGLSYVYRGLRAIDAILLLGVPGAYLASGLIPLVICWEGIASLSRLVLG
jgi:hypothetical protein